jgi:type IX secretion system PorP/SprF family membrane protein
MCHAQQEILYTQYVYNELTINPAYAGYHDALNITLNSRKQWIGLEGSPMTMTLAGHMALDKNTECEAFRLQRNGGMKRNTTHNKTALGLLIYNDRIGVDNTLQANLSYAYKIIFNGGRLSFGLQGSVLNYRQDFVNLDKSNMDDPVFTQNIQKTMVNFGTGVFFDNNRFYLGVSVPQMMKNYLGNSSSEDSRQLRQYFFTGGYLLYINRFFKFKPSFMFRYTEEIPYQLDINSMIIYNDNLYFGVSYRNKNTITTIFQVNFAERIRIGLAYDYNILNEFKKAANGTVEVLLSYNFKSSVHKIVNPRYF